MSQYKLTYFNGRGRAEIIRLIFAAAGVSYEDNRITKEQWPALKPTTPFGQLPIVEIDGVKFGQAMAIARFLACKFNLSGKTDLDQLKVNMLIDCMEDVLQSIKTVFSEQDADKKCALAKKFREEQLQVYLDNLEKLLKENKGGDGYLVGDSLTLADLAFLSLVDWLAFKQLEAADLIEKKPKLCALRARLQQLPKIAAWLAKRPQTDF